MSFQPMLAYRKKIDVETLRYPLYASPKYDGIRALVTPDVQLQSRRLRRIPNHYARKLFEDPRLIGCEGELIAGDPTAPDVMSRTTSAVMSEDTRDEQLTFRLFDHFLRPEVPYGKRLEYLIYREPAPLHAFVIEQTRIQSFKEAYDYEEKVVQLGYEGVMLRDVQGHYKYGRSGLKEQLLLKWKRFEDGEAVILDVEEMMHNDNEATTDARGYTKRSKKQAGMRPAGMLGRLHVRDLETNVDFYLGAGPLLTLPGRIALWKMRHQLPGKFVHYRFQPVGVKDKPRFCRVIAFRNEIDL